MNVAKQGIFFIAEPYCDTSRKLDITLFTFCEICLQKAPPEQKNVQVDDVIVLKNKFESSANIRKKKKDFCRVFILRCNNQIPLKQKKEKIIAINLGNWIKSSARLFTRMPIVNRGEWL